MQSIDDRTFIATWNACECVAEFVVLTGYVNKAAAATRACRLRKLGNAVKKMPFQKMKTPAVRFWEKVAKTDLCWVWAGSVNKKGYGQISQGRRGERPFLTHRFSWELHNGKIPGDLLVLHRCDNPRCVRPDHLFLGTAADNTTDMMNKERGPHA